VTRLSLGVQSLSDNVLKSVHRRADSSCIKQALGLIKLFWTKKVSADLICGLPGETPDSMKHALDTLIQNEIPHISFYSLCVEEETPLGKKITSGEQNYDPDFSDSLWLEGRDFLLSRGYEQYEISNFCLPGFECIHNMTYWTHDDYIGVGSGAYGTVYSEHGDTCGTGLRINNTLDIHKYCEFWNSENKIIEKNIPQQTESLDKQTSIFEYFMMGLRTKKGISSLAFRRKFNQELPENIIKKLEDWKSKGLCCLEKLKTKQGDEIIDDTCFYLNSEGMLFLNRFLEEL
jgi:oxygen-independent coproporphyrinogen-3 oxidase